MALLPHGASEAKKANGRDKPGHRHSKGLVGCAYSSGSTLTIAAP
jgi:hypothetical protein